MYLKIVLFVITIICCISCNSNTNTKSGFIIKKEFLSGKSFGLHTVKYSGSIDKKVSGTILYADFTNDTIKALVIDPAPCYDVKKHCYDDAGIVQLNNATQLLLIEDFITRLQKEYVFNSDFRIEIDSRCLGDAAIELYDGKKRDKYVEVLKDMDYYKNFCNLLTKFNMTISDIFIEDVYPEDSNEIRHWCIISDEYQGHSYAATIIRLRINYPR